MNDQPFLLSWIVPLYRNGSYAAELLRRTHAAAQAIGIESEIIMVDDCCPEQSGRQAQSAAQAQSALRVQVLLLPANLGQDSAIREALRACRGTHALIIDGDLQDPPEVLAQLWPPMLREDPDVVFAARWGHYESTGRLITSRVYRKAMEWIGGLPPRAGVCALLNRRAIRCVAATRVRQVSLLAAVAGGRLACVSVPVQRSPRSDQRSAYTSLARTHKALLSLLQTIRARWLHLPL